MNKVVFGALLLAVAVTVPLSAGAQVSVTVNIPLPPAITFAAPPSVIVLPGANDVYVVPEIAADVFFWNGWWWRMWDGRWYRSHYYDRGWHYYKRVPSFYYGVDPNWRAFYRDHAWEGHRWNYERIPYGQLQQNWKNWHTTQHWEKQGTWGVQGYRPPSPQERKAVQQQRQRQYQPQPEVRQPQVRPEPQQHQRPPQVQQREQQRPPQGQPPRQPQESVRGQQHEQRPQGHEAQHPQNQGRGEEEHNK